MQIQEKFLAQKRLKKSENVSKRFSVLFVVPLHCLGDRVIDEAVRAFAVRFDLTVPNLVLRSHTGTLSAARLRRCCST